MWNRPTVPLLDRFLAKVQVNSETGCWEWQGSKNHRGQGVIRPSGYERARSASRVAMHLYHEMHLDDSRYVIRSCKTKSCCNPEHLRLVGEA